MMIRVMQNTKDTVKGKLLFLSDKRSESRTEKGYGHA